MGIRKSAQIRVEAYLDSVAEFSPEGIPTLTSVLRYRVFPQKQKVLVNKKEPQKLSYKNIASMGVNLYTFMAGRVPFMPKWVPEVQVLWEQKIAWHPQGV